MRGGFLFLDVCKSVDVLRYLATRDNVGVMWIIV